MIAEVRAKSGKEAELRRQDFEAHNATPHVQAWFARLPELADGGVHVVRMGVLGNDGVTSK